MERVAHTEETDVGLINATGALAAQLASLEASIDRQLEAFSELQTQRDDLLAALKEIAWASYEQWVSDDAASQRETLRVIAANSIRAITKAEVR